MAEETKMDPSPTTMELEESPISEDDYSSSSGSSSEEEEYMEEDNNNGKRGIPEMPLFKYARVNGNVPRSKEDNDTNCLEVACTCSCIGRISLQQQQQQQQSYDVSSSLSKDETIFVVALGLENGSVMILDPMTGTTIVPSTHLPVLSSTSIDTKKQNDKNNHHSIVQVRFDASGTVLAAMTQSGHVAIFEIKYYYPNNNNNSNTATMQASSTAITTAATVTSGDSINNMMIPVENMFGSFLSKLAGDEDTTTSATTKSSSHIHPQSSSSQKKGSSTLSAEFPIPVTRLSYSTTSSKNMTKATCMALDPAYKKKRDKKLVVVGFSDGRVLMTKQGTGLFGRRHDIAIYQASGSGSLNDNNSGIEALEWRGILLASADSSGIKLYDTDRMTRIAHIDRPTGARSSLYPTISSLRPHLYFERSDSLLVAWGDCLVHIHIREETTNKQNQSSTPTNTTSNNNNNNNTNNRTSSMDPSSNNAENSAPTSSQQVVDRRVECGLAWQLDGISVGAVPMDANHIAILLLYPTPTMDDEDEILEQVLPSSCQGLSPSGNNTLELQVLKRHVGMTISSDALPLLYRKPIASVNTKIHKMLTDSTSQYTFLSSYCTPQMEDYLHVEEEYKQHPQHQSNHDALTNNNNTTTNSTSNAVNNPSASETASNNQNPSNHSTSNHESNQNDGLDLEKEIISAMTATFASSSSSHQIKNKRFKDYFLRWDIQNVHPNDDDDIDDDDDEEEKEESKNSDDDTEMTVKQENMKQEEHDIDDDKSTSSVDSDDYSFLFQNTKAKQSNHSMNHKSPSNKDSKITQTTIDPPFLWITSHDDIILAQTRDMDDCVDHARNNGKYGLALKRALKYRHQLASASDTLEQLTNDYLSAVLYPPTQTNTLTVRRLRLAARTMPILLGTNMNMWERWIYEFAKIPGGLFVLRPYVPTRDPMLPQVLYEMILEKMLIEVESMLSLKTATSENDVENNQQITKKKKKITNRYSGSVLDDNLSHAQKGAIKLYLRTLRGWGPMTFMRERIKLEDRQQQQQQNPIIQDLREDFFMRITHSCSSTYLQYPIDIKEFDAKFGIRNNNEKEGNDDEVEEIEDKKQQQLPGVVIASHHNNPINQGPPVAERLYDVRSVAAHLVPRISHKSFYSSSTVNDINNKGDGKPNIASALALEALAEVYMMEGNYKEALQLYLIFGAHFMTQPLSSLETDAINSITEPNIIHNMPETRNHHRFSHVLPMIENHQLFNYLLDETFLNSFYEDDNEQSSSSLPPTSVSTLPLAALICLVGLDLSGRFLLEHSILPTISATASSTTTLSSSMVEVPGTMLPIHSVANQFQTRPKLQLWYLHSIILLHKPDIYVRFPTTAVPPRIITDLHRIHLELYIQYANRDHQNNLKNLSDVPTTYEDMDMESPLISFLKVALPHGGVRSEEVRRMLEDLRSGGSGSLSSSSAQAAGVLDGNASVVKYPHLYSSELAYVIERAGSDTEENAKYILSLYLEGSKSLPLAVSYAERNTIHSELLWNDLISYCLKSTSENSEPDGLLFGSLLEVASRFGADLSNLVSKIPTGMRIEGIRPKLVSAISDYRLKLKIHESSSTIMEDDKIDLLRQLSHRSRRGLRVEYHGPMRNTIAAAKTENNQNQRDYSTTMASMNLEHSVPSDRNQQYESNINGMLWHHRKNLRMRSRPTKVIPIR